MAEEGSSSGRTAIILAVISVAGGIATATIANWDKLFHTGIAASPQAISGAASAATAPPATASPVAVAGSLPTVPASLTGEWGDEDGYSYVVRNPPGSTEFGYTVSRAGNDVGAGAGLIQGRVLKYQFRNLDGNAGYCGAEVAADGQSIAGTCTSGTGSWPFRVTRTRS